MSTPTADQKLAAYYRGRNAGFATECEPTSQYDNDFSDPILREEYDIGYRHARRECALERSGQ